MQSLPYSLQAVFIHSGQVSYGHYWIYIFDFERKIWRKYNDDYVTEVTDVSEIFEENPRKTASPYFLVYVKDELKESLVKAVVRDMLPLPHEEPEPQELGPIRLEGPDRPPRRRASDSSEKTIASRHSGSSLFDDYQAARVRGRSPPPSYDELTPAGTHNTNSEYSYPPARFFYNTNVDGDGAKEDDAAGAVSGAAEGSQGPGMGKESNGDATRMKASDDSQ
ncbi:ubiquitin-specific protease ubp2, partial [Ascosphaera atra]